MPEKYQNKYRINSTRLRNWDYSRNAAYFITICTQNREHYFGEIIDGEMRLSEIGKIVENEWLKTYKMRPDMNLQLDAFVVMPNHFHAIIIIGENKYNTQYGAERGAERRDAMHCVSTTDTTDTTDTNTTPSSINKFGPQTKNLASIIRGFKIGVTTNARKINSCFAWQPRYYDHIIRNQKSFNKIREYIIDNPKNWNIDKFYNN
jgi:REP element-mobilizing transposase RayT